MTPPQWSIEVPIDIATPEAIDDAVCEIMVKYGPDRHVDGHEILADYIVRLLAAERERCAKIAEQHACEQCWDIAAKIRSGE